MSSHEQAVASLLSNFAFCFDGAVLGLALAYTAVRTIVKFTSHSTALRRIRNAPSVRVSDLRAVLERSDSGEDELVIVRGVVEPKSAVDGSWRSFSPNTLISQESGDRAVIRQRTQTCIYNEWRGFFGWTSDLRAVLSRSLREKSSTSLRTVPFILVEGIQWPPNDYVVVSLDGSNHHLPLTTVYHQLQPINASPYTFLQALFGHEYPVGILDEEKILPVGKDVSAVGLCFLKKGILEIKSCKDLPYFLSEMTKDEMLVDLAWRTNILFWGGIILGSVSVGILGVAIVRNWNRWKDWRQRRQDQHQRQSEVNEPNAHNAEDESEEIPDGQLCVICLMRRRRSAFIPCGHLVCCQRCSLSVERDVSPKCPVCRQPVSNSFRIYDS